MCRFREEAGFEASELDGIMIDEVSFLELGVLGHADNCFRLLLGADVYFGGVPLLLGGDCHQRPPPAGTPWHKLIVQAAAGEGENPLRQGVTSAKKLGLALLRAARLVELQRLMRAEGDVAFIAHQRAMRRTEVLHPIPDAFLQQLSRQVLSASDLREDAAWRFAPVGVLAHIERDAINHAQLRAFAEHFGLPIIKWRRQLADDAFESDAERDALYAHERNLWSYFVEGAPVHLLETIKSVRKLVNGSAGLLDSLELRNDVDRRRVAEAYEAGFNDGREVELELAPLAVNVVVGGTADAPRLWHGVPLDDLTGLVEPTTDGAQVVPVLCSVNLHEVDNLSTYAAQQGLAQKLRVKIHQYDFAFALTDYKLQGRTIPRLVLSVCRRHRAPWMYLSAFYVLISRVRELSGLRLLLNDKDGLQKVAEQESDEYLHAWHRGYVPVAPGSPVHRWSDVRAAETLRARRESKASARAAEAAKRKAEKEAERGAAKQRRQDDRARERAAGNAENRPPRAAPPPRPTAGERAQGAQGVAPRAQGVAQGGGAGELPEETGRRCSKCGQRGHNARTCGRVGGDSGAPPARRQRQGEPLADVTAAAANGRV